MKSRMIVALIMVVMMVATLQSLLLLPAVKAVVAYPVPDTDTDITVAQAYAMIYSNSMPNLVIMDVRTAAQYAGGFVPGAINVPITPPISNPPPVFGATAFDALYAWISSPVGQSHLNDPIIVYCGSGARSEAASNILNANGFTNVYDMPPYSTWAGAGYPTIKVTATININPDTLNLKSNGKWVTCYIELPTPNSVSDIVVSTIKMDNVVPAALSPTAIGDYNSNGVPDLMVKCDRAAVQGLLSDGEIRLPVTFTLSDGTHCGGWDIVNVIG